MNDLIERAKVLLEKLDIEEKKARIRTIEAKSSDPDFWKDTQSASAKMKEMAALQKEIEDAEKLKIKNGDNVRVRSRYGETVIPIKVDERIKQGELFATFHNPKLFLNYITSPHRDTHVLTPEYKVTAVQIEKI